MKLTIERELLLWAINHVHRVAQKKPVIPMYGQVLLRLFLDGDLQLMATDGDIEIIESIPAEVSGSIGDFTVPAYLLHDIVRKLDKTPITIERSEDKAIVKAGSSRFTLSTLPASDFPSFQGGAIVSEFNLSTKDLALLFDKAHFAMSTEEARYYLCGIYLRKHDSLLRAVATNGHMLARIDVPAPSGAPDNAGGIIIPRKTIENVQRLINQVDCKDICVGISSTHIHFQIANVTINSRLIDGAFPDYARVIPSQNTKLLTANLQDLTCAIDRVSTVVREEGGRPVKLHMNDNKLELSVKETQRGSAVEEIDVSYLSDPLTIGFNSQYMLNILSKIDGETVMLAFSDMGSPALITGKDTPEQLYVIMPMRV